ncbi:MAG: hypothetical protein ACRCZP_13080 [Phycicoccus sp.]
MTGAVELLARGEETTSGTGGGTLLVVILLVVRLASGLLRRGSAGHGHVHSGQRAQVARHEAGHAVVAKAVGGTVKSARVDESWLSGASGRVEWHMHGRTDKQRAEQHMAALMAGQLAAGRSSGCWSDDDEVRRIQRLVPEADRNAAERRARQIVRSRSGEIDRAAARLDRDGRL